MNRQIDRWILRIHSRFRRSLTNQSIHYFGRYQLNRESTDAKHSVDQSKQCCRSIQAKKIYFMSISAGELSTLLEQRISNYYTKLNAFHNPNFLAVLFFQ